MGTFLGKGLLTEINKVPIYLLSYKGRQKGRHKLNINKKYSRSSHSKKYSNCNKEPWILVSSDGSKTANIVVKIYEQRMQIEEDFRDTKCMRYGFGLNESRSKSCDRMSILLLIAAIASFASWLAGIYIRESDRACAYQSPSAKNKNVLSYVFLGREALKKGFKLLRKHFDVLCEKLLYLAIPQV